MEAEPHKLRGAPGHPVKYLLHRSCFDLGSHYKNVVNWEFEKTKPFHRKNLLAHFGCVNAIEFAKNGSLLASGGDDRRVLLWKVEKALVSKVEPVVMQAEHLSNVFSLDFSCSSEKIISAGNDDQVILHDIGTGVPLDYFVHEQPVYGVSADPVNENIFCSACDDGRILIFDIRDSGSDPFCLAKVESPFHSVMFHPVEPRLVVTSNSKEGVACWDVRMPKKTFVKYGLQNSSQCCMSARFNKLGTQILVLRRRLPPILYSTDSPSHLYQFNHRGYYNSCTMKSCSFAGQNDQYVVSGSDNFDLHVWKIPTTGSDQWVNKADIVLRGHRSIVNQVRYNYAHNVIASSGVEKIVKLWSPFPMPDERGGKSPAVITNESKRRIYTPDDYVSLVMQAGQGHFMSLTFEGGRKTTREDSRMLAFFDALVQRDINAVSDDESDAFYETSYTNTVYTSPETSSSDDDDDDSNPPDFRSLLSAESVNNSFRNGLSQNSGSSANEQVRETSANAEEAVVVEPSNSAINHESDEETRSEEINDSGHITPQNQTTAGSCDTEPNQQTDAEDKDVTTNIITRLILEKEDSRRKHNSHSKANEHETDSNDSFTSDEENSQAGPSQNQNSTSRPLKVSRSSKKSKRSRKSKRRYKQYSKFRKHVLELRRRERMANAAPVYDSSRNAPEDSVPATETSFSRISELMTRSQSTLDSDSSVDSSSSSSSDSSSSDKECEGVANTEKKKKSSRSKKSVARISSDSSSSSDGNRVDIDSNDNAVSEKNQPSCSSSRTTNSHRSVIGRDYKRKRKPQCKLSEACKAYFKQYLASESDSQKESNEPLRKRAKPDSPENSAAAEAPTQGPSSLVERVVFKKLGKHAKGRNYRKVSATAGSSSTPTDSGIEVSKEPNPSSSKSVSTKNIPKTKTVNPDSKLEIPKKSNCTNDSSDTVDDPGYGHVDSSDSSDESNEK